MPALSVAEWKDRIAPHLSTSLQTVSEQITRTEGVQTWLQEASMRAAEGLGQTSGMQAEMQGYMRMMDDLEAHLPNLVTAVDDLTDGIGSLDLHWRPLSPNYSRLYITFDRDYTLSLFCRLSKCTADAAQDVLDTIGEALPEGDPFPGRPNDVTALVAHDGRALGVRLKEHLAEEGGRYRTVTLLPDNGDAVEQLSPPDAVTKIRRRLCDTTPDA